MDEKVLIQGEKKFTPKQLKLFCFVGSILSLGVGVIMFILYLYCDIQSSRIWDKLEHYDYFDSEYKVLRAQVDALPGGWYDFNWVAGLFVLIAIGLFLIGWLVYYIWSKYELTITDKRVYGKVLFGKRVDLPLDSISAVGTSFLWGVDFGTSSGRIHFKFMKNKNEIHAIISNLLIERQKTKKALEISKPTISSSDAEEIKKFKDLLDSGIITQEEFEAKKKQLLGL